MWTALFALHCWEEKKKWIIIHSYPNIDALDLEKKLKKKKYRSIAIYVYLFYRYFCAFYFYENSIESYTNAKPSWSALNHTTNTVEVLSIKCKCHFEWKKPHSGEHEPESRNSY